MPALSYIANSILLARGDKIHDNNEDGGLDWYTRVSLKVLNGHHVQSLRAHLSGVPSIFDKSVKNISLHSMKSSNSVYALEEDDDSGLSSIRHREHKLEFGTNESEEMQEQPAKSNIVACRPRDQQEDREGHAVPAVELLSNIGLEPPKTGSYPLFVSSHNLSDDMSKNKPKESESEGIESSGDGVITEILTCLVDNFNVDDPFAQMAQSVMNSCKGVLTFLVLWQDPAIKKETLDNLHLWTLEQDGLDIVQLVGERLRVSKGYPSRVLDTSYWVELTSASGRIATTAAAIANNQRAIQAKT
ncbi:hypothetical protein HDU67_005520 [Dinochytrium kinnereticum]|nr:hypothetical protein HDU67_005520 [Dinochytrium kinnereticum]